MSPSKDTEESPVDAEVTPDTEVLSGDENKENLEAQVAETLTFAEWKQQQEQIRSKPQYNIRKANEGGEKVKGKEIKKLTEEEKEEDGSLFFPKKYYEEKYKTSGRVKEHMNLDFNYTSGDNRHLDTENRGRRGGRGGGRGRGRGRGGRDENSGRRDQRDRDESPTTGGGFGEPATSGGFGGFGSSPVDDAEIQLENDQEFPTLG
jgi:hypothetical protein